MIDADFVSAIVENAQAKAVVVNGKGYSSAQLFNPPLPIEPEFPALQVHALDSLIGYIKENRDSIEFAGCQIQSQAQSAELISGPKGENRKRDVMVKAASGAPNHVFGQYQSLEDFRIYLMSQFRDTPDRETVLRFLARITDEVVKTSEDDGISQTVIVKSGIASHASATVPSPLQLAPIRTFIEVEQPIGSFIFRLKQIKDALPQAGLWELHTNWKREAAVATKAYLDKAIEGLAVKVPVLA